MTSITKTTALDRLKYPKFDLIRLLKTCLHPEKGESLCILVDFDNPNDIVGASFLKSDKYLVQKKAYDVFYQGLLQGGMQELGLKSCDIYAYKATRGSNLELPNSVISEDGKLLNLERDIYKVYDIILCITDYSATAPLTAAAKKFGFRGATMHGVNDVIINSGLSVDYHDVSKKTENLRQGMTKADFVEIDFQVKDKDYHLHIDLENQEAQKSHGLCNKNEIANLPAGEVYFVPNNANGSFPIKFEEDGTLGLMTVQDGRVKLVSLIKGKQSTVDRYQNKFIIDPASSILGELGFGTQVLPFAAADIQDEKIFGTFHLAIGRNDHLSGHVTKELFHDLQNATHEDILFSATKTPEITVKQVRMMRKGKMEVLIENYKPSDYLLKLAE